MLGSNDRSILRGGIGPRHQVKISESFEITRHPVSPEIALEMIKSGEAELASESEWAVFQGARFDTRRTWYSRDFGRFSQQLLGKTV